MPKRKTDEETAMKEKEKEKENKERESNILRVMYVIFCVTCIWIAARIVYLQCNFIDSDPYLRFFRAKSKKVLAEPTRGAILSSDGRLLAISVPMYQVYMDCTVRKEEFSARDKHGKLIDKHGEEHEEEWRASVADLAKGLYAIYGKSSEYWRATILNERNKGNKYLKIGGTIDHETLQKALQIEEGKDQDNAKFPGQCTITLRRWSRNRFREVTDGGLFCLAEINAIVKFLKDNELSTL